MRRDHRPYFIKRYYADLMRLYVSHFLRPQLASLGKGFLFLKPWHMRIHGSPIGIGRYVNIVASSDNKVRLTVWPSDDNQGRIQIGDYCLICPGVRISSAADITIGDNCMLAYGVYLTDSDWHDNYNRTSTGNPVPLTIEENVWIGDSATLCKGVTVGKNSIIGAGAVVTHDVPPNTIAAGNPARVVKHLDPNQKMTPRSEYYSNPEQLFEFFDWVDRDQLKKNTFSHWLRSLLFPREED